MQTSKKHLGESVGMGLLFAAACVGLVAMMSSLG
jgi:hypothetical protein